MDTDDLLESIQIEDYIGQYVELSPDSSSGEDLFGVCPLHDDSDPSFSVTPSAGVWYCFGCHKGGTVIQFAQQYHHLSFGKAVEHLKKYANISDDGLQNTRHLNVTGVLKRYYPKKKKQKTRSYKVLPSNIMSRYDPPGDKLRGWRDEGMLDSVMEQYQVRYDPFSNRLVFPIRLPDGKIINICGRTLDPDFKTKLDANGKKVRKYTYFYDLGILDTLFGLYEHIDEIKRKKEIILFEGAKSVMLAEGWGVLNTAAVLTSKINPYQLRLLIQLGVRVVFALDAEVSVSDIQEVQKLKHFVTVEAVINRDGLLKPKDAPVDAGREVWENLYKRRCRIQ